MWKPYLESICQEYAKWWEVYTLTDVAGKKRLEQRQNISPLLDLGLMVQTIESEEKQRERPEEKIERLTVLEGLRKYAPNHVLLVGRPGSGKSTALARLLLEEAEKLRSSLEKEESPLSPPFERGETRDTSPFPRGETRERREFPRNTEGETRATPPFQRGVGGDKNSQRETRGNKPRIPILIELRYSQTSILDRIQKFIHKHHPTINIDKATLETWLRQGEFLGVAEPRDESFAPHTSHTSRTDVDNKNANVPTHTSHTSHTSHTPHTPLLLLFDGFNEMASEAARQQVRMFRQDYPNTAMVFTTRDLSLGGDLGIEKRLEMLPLTESQMQEFVCAYLPEHGENLWQQLQGRLRELGETPMFLLMLCSVFGYNKVIPAHLGLVFRSFTQTYSSRLKQDVPVDESSRRWWDRLLQELAWVMTNGESKTEIMVAISRQKAEEVLAEFLRGEVVAPTDCAMRWLEDLLEHHLIQVGDDGQISFRHQLLQEYYVAERLLLRLSGLSDYELQWDYLNYLKWTEVVALMLGLVEDEGLAVRVVRLALEVDWFLGARLVGEVQRRFQERMFAEVERLELPVLLEVYLAELTKSDAAVPGLILLLEDSDKYVRWSAVFAIGKIGSETAIEGLIPLLKGSDSFVRRRAAEVLGEIGSESVIEELIPLLKDSDFEVRRRAAEALGKIGSESVIEELIPLLKDSDSEVRRRTAEALGKISSETAIARLIPLLEDSEFNVFWRAAKALGEIGSESVIEELIPLLKNSDSFVRRRAAEALGEIASETAIEELIPLLEDSEFNVRWSTVEALGEIGSESVIEELIPLLKNSDSFVRWRAAEALGKIGSETAIEELIPLLEDSEFNVRWSTTEALGKIGSETAIKELIPLLEDSDSFVRWSAVEALIEIRRETGIPRLILLLEDSDYYLRMRAVEALGKVGSETAIPKLIPLLEHPDPYMGWRAGEALVKIASQTGIPKLIPLLEHSNYNVSWSAAEALVKIGSQTAIEGLIPFLEDSNSNVSMKAAVALGEIGSETAIPKLIPLLENSESNVRWRAAIALGKIGSETAVEGLIPLLKDSEYNVRSSAAEALGKVGSETAIEGLIPLLEDSESNVCRSAAEALSKIGSENTTIELTKKLQNDRFVKQMLSETIDTIKTIQQRLQYYKPTPKIPMSKTLSHNYALLIGVGDCKYPNWSLPTTVKDVQTIKSFLINPDLCSYIDKENYLRFLSNEQATKQNILDNLNWLQQKAKNDPEATILVYYSGHGWLDKSTQNYYLIPHDTSPVKPQKTALPATEFNNALQQISAQKLLVIIDSCHAQGMATAKQTEELELPENFSQTALPKNLIADLRKGTGRAVFTSSTGDELSWIRSDGKMSIYTYHFLEALQGGGNKPGDKIVTVSNLMSHVSKTVPESAQKLGKKQTPMFDFSQTEDFPVALLRGGKGLPDGGWEEVKQEAQENIQAGRDINTNTAGRDIDRGDKIDIDLSGSSGVTIHGGIGSK
ncbi:HEAT repeat domain-containing protein [Okeania sp. SIO3I5]|uniref:HEAT repeat domain-containing protein n=1 Tax=Okeania sp. SIO3I5 TaxID=2607805 RepID=UPI0025E028E4|nr:HEAT repeat domain-containing protein [Okeania sp. SIO3I5]